MKEKIKQFRKSKGWSQKKMAQEVGVSLRTVTYWEAGEKVPGKMAVKLLVLVGFQND